MKNINMILIILISIIMILIIPNNTLATEEETDLLLDRFFEYVDNYYNVDFNNNYDIHSQYLQNHLSFIHYNKQAIKSKFIAYKNSSDENMEKYSKFNSIGLMCWNTSFNLSLLYIPNNENNNNYAFTQYQGNQNRTVVYYNQKHTNRITLSVNNQGVISDLTFIDTGPLNSQVSDLNVQGNNFSYYVGMYLDDNYYCSLPQWNGNTSYFVNDTNKRLNGQSDYGFFNINYNNIQRIDVDENIVFGDLYVGYNYSINNQTIYLYNETTSQLMNNEINLIPIGGLYNGRYHYQVVCDDLENLNEHNQYRLICSSSSRILAGFISDKFKFDFKEPPPGQELPYIMILSGDYNGVGSGDGFNNAINDINNNLGVIGGFINGLDNDLKDDSDVDNGINQYTQMTSGELAAQLGYKSGDNEYGNFIYNIFKDLCDVLTDDNNRTLVLGFHDNHSIVLNSDEFVLPAGNPFQIFISGFVTFVYIFLIYDEVRKILDKIEEGNVLYVLDAGDAIGYSYSRFF